MSSNSNKPDTSLEYRNEIVVEKDKNVKRKSILSAQVQEILKEEKLDFAKLLEAVRNDKFPCEEGDDYDNFDYENYPDESWHDVTDEEEVETDGTDKEMGNDEYDEPIIDLKCSN